MNDTQRRLLNRIQKTTSGCWEFTGHRNEHGYGVLYVGMDDGRRVRKFAHRVSYEQFVGEIPTDQRYEIHHVCENPSCVNPAHLECLTRSQHALLGRQAQRTTCPHGHPRSEENISIDSRGHVRCKVCDREKRRAWRRERGLKQAGWHNAAKTHCANGHPYDEENTYLRPNGGRACRTCMKAADRRFKERRRAVATRNAITTEKAA